MLSHSPAPVTGSVSRRAKSMSSEAKDDAASGEGGGKKTPSDFLKTVLGRPVVVKLNSGVDYRGVLACLDGYMNIAMEQTEEYVDGQLKNKYGDCFIRGNNGACFCPQKGSAGGGHDVTSNPNG